jgi:PKD repeat protein
MQAPNLVANFAPIFVSIPVNTTVTFTDTSTTDGGSIVAWQWDFGDGGTGSGQGVSHTYTASGDYTVMLSVTDTCSYTETKRIPGAVKVEGRYEVFLPLVLRDGT